VKRYDWLIVGAGFTGATLAERIASQLGQKVLVIDQRDHIAGNAFDAPEADGLLVHRYGPHIFHTNSDAVWNYLSGFTAWRPYFHKVLGHIDGQFVPLPFNINSIETIFPQKLAQDIIGALVDDIGFNQRVPILKLLESDRPELKLIADYVFEKVFKNYTLKQWGLLPTELNAGVTARVPIAISRDDRYFTDRFQAMPRDGYTAMFKRMLDHPNIDVQLSTPWNPSFPDVADRMIFTGPIDAYFGEAHGPLPYRSLRFDFVREAKRHYQPVGTVNYPNEFEFTRITEQKYLSDHQSDDTLLVFEYPEAYVPGVNDPYYPILNDASQSLLNRYTDDAKDIADRVLFAGRLADYCYYNMDQACARALSLFTKKILPMTKQAAPQV
jgi:UDP-galactopyranose mutase